MRCGNDLQKTGTLSYRSEAVLCKECKKERRSSVMLRTIDKRRKERIIELEEIKQFAEKCLPKLEERQINFRRKKREREERKKFPRF